jgi:hypothetical protein
VIGWLRIHAAPLLKSMLKNVENKEVIKTTGAATPEKKVKT